LLRRVSAAGDFATVLHRGDDISGAVILIHRARDGHETAFQRAIGGGGDYHWRIAATGESIAEWLGRQRKFDPDLWVIELDTPDPARFIDEPIA